ncbi:NAD(P)-dependent oxidoreductase [Anaerococcus sp. AGMB00486]|uniref:NAD(P)-dependent oxidoreductase n=2 Tax=Anaerococcus TaxID=165779 RepID=A0ABX2NAL2_9FIRM|nr:MULTISPECIES: SAF domain-containing protein [Anaerococcus]MSS77739.1 NAD(P)-dependent oxidoreductase [Anaerococcus porci]NVF11594.1 NAD(P)-dependent oxidoreductase [Anaerococcus faecalis]
MTLYDQLKKREEEKNPIKVGVIGAGQMGRGMIAQISTIPGMIVTGISDLNLEAANKARDAFNKNLDNKVDILTSTDYRDVINNDEVEVVVEATGVTEVGAKVCLESLLAKKNLVLLNVEIDITIGSIMKKLFDSAGLVYTGSNGDEPAEVVKLYEFAKAMGMEVLVAGKGKNNKLKVHANPDTSREEADRKNMNPHMLTAFQDGTKTMAEMNLLSNAIGFKPDIVGMHGISGDLDGTVDQLKLKSEGGVLDNYGVVEYVDGLAPGVFVIVKGQNDGVKEELNYLMKKGEKDRHILYRPFHLASLETPISIAKAVLNNDHSIVPLGIPVSDTVAYTKKDIKKGEIIDGIGGYCVRGVIEKHEDCMNNKHIPIGLITGDTIAKEDIPADSYLTFENTEIDTNTSVYKLRKLQDEFIG